MARTFFVAFMIIDVEHVELVGINVKMGFLHLSVIIYYLYVPLERTGTSAT